MPGRLLPTSDTPSSQREDTTPLFARHPLEAQLKLGR
jgi:hypothetical protein